MAETGSSGKPGLSFKFTKKVDNKVLAESKLSEDKSEGKQDKDFVLSLEGKEVKSSAPKPKKEELVIPLIKDKSWHKHKKDDSKIDEENPSVTSQDPGKLSLEQQAVQELIDDAKKDLNAWEEQGNDGPKVDAIVQPGNVEDPELVGAPESSLDDYDRVPIEEYGTALLRGMGWQPGAPIGARNKEVVKPIDVVVRPKGLGLGADKLVKKATKPSSKRDKDDEKLVLKTGAYVYIEEGANKGLYGQVDGLDEENARVVVKLALGGKVVTANEIFIRVIKKSEYKDSKVINKDKYDEYKKKDTGGYKENETVDLRVDAFDHQDTKRERGRDKHDKKSKRHKTEKQERYQEPSKQIAKPWLRPHIKVRFIDKSYMRGHYYNTKVIIEDVMSEHKCLCRTEDGKVLEEIHSSMLETVIPRNELGYVMVLSGKKKGQVGRVLKRDKGNCVATVQLLPDDDVCQFDYDSVSEYMGDVSQYY